MRLVQARSTTEEDWRSHYEMGAVPRKTQIESALIHMGLSMYDSDRMPALVNLANRYGDKLGRFVVSVQMDGDLGVWLAETGSLGHFTVWGRPADLQRCVHLPAEPI